MQKVASSCSKIWSVHYFIVFSVKIRFCIESFPVDNASQPTLPQIYAHHTIRANLPSYEQISPSPDIPYNNRVYNDITTWQKNIFLVPTGKQDKLLILLLKLIC